MIIKWLASSQASQVTRNASLALRPRPRLIRTGLYDKQQRRDIMTESVGPVARRIREKLLTAFAPQHLDVVNESSMHNVPKGSETHFKVVVVTDQFNGKPLLQRHRMVNAVLQQELDEGVHALSILSKTPQQWEANAVVKASPGCRGGMAADETKKEFLETLKGKAQHGME